MRIRPAVPRAVLTAQRLRRLETVGGAPTLAIESTLRRRFPSQGGRADGGDRGRLVLESVPHVLPDLLGEAAVGARNSVGGYRCAAAAASMSAYVSTAALDWLRSGWSCSAQGLEQWSAIGTMGRSSMFCLQQPLRPASRGPRWVWVRCSVPVAAQLKPDVGQRRHARRRPHRGPRPGRRLGREVHPRVADSAIRGTPRRR